jgi:N-acetylglucosaminyldiphosphoundecaprenol N-acetyl-beta-D-mannosaminyltransferase
MAWWRINAAQPDLVWVGISSPRQERWMAEHRERLAAPVLIGVGAAFDFLSGRKPQAPRWMQRAGIEWLFRLATEPGRLWRRYVRYPLFAVLVAGEALGLVRVDRRRAGATTSFLACLSRSLCGRPLSRAGSGLYCASQLTLHG